MTRTSPSARAKVERHPERGRYDAATIHAILDEAFVAHVGVTTADGPVVIPMVYGREGATLYLHGSVKSRLLNHTGPICVTVTLVDGLVLAKSLFHHSINYRSVAVFAKPRVIEDDDEKRQALDVISEHIIAGRTGDARAPNQGELDATAVLAVSLQEASAKIREGPPGDEPKEDGPPVWSGVLPLRQTAGRPIPDEHTAVDVPWYLRDYRRPGT